MVAAAAAAAAAAVAAAIFLQLESLETKELKNQLAEQAKRISQLEGQLRVFDTHTQVKCGQFKAELRNRMNSAHLSRQCAVALEPEQIGGMMTGISPMSRPRTDKS